MKVLSKIAIGVLAFSMGQSALCASTVISPFLTSSGLSGGTTAAEVNKAEKLGLDEADVLAIREGRMTENIRLLAKDNQKSEKEIMEILQAEFQRE
jgi:hypothetical protein